MTLKNTRIYNSDEIEKINGVIVQNAATEIASSISTHAPLTGTNEIMLQRIQEHFELSRTTRQKTQLKNFEDRSPANF